MTSLAQWLVQQQKPAINAYDMTKKMTKCILCNTQSLATLKWWVLYRLYIWICNSLNNDDYTASV